MTKFEQDVIERLTRIEAAILPVADHEIRLRSVERKAGWLSGVIAVVGILATPVLGWLGVHFKPL